MENIDNLFLIYVNPIGKNSEGLFEYEFFFSETPESVWGQDWNVQAPSACANTLPEESTYSLKKRLVTDIPLFCAQENSCYSMGDMMDNIIACANEDISEYSDFPEPYRLVFPYAMPYTEVIEHMSGREISFNN